MAPFTNLIEDVDTTKITNDNLPAHVGLMVDQMKIFCVCLQSMKAQQEEDHNCLLLFRVSRCGLNWLKDPNNIKSFISILIFIWIICVIFMGSADQISRMFSHYVFHYP